MVIETSDFGTGWMGVTAGLRGDEIDTLIELLTLLKHGSIDHFHTRALFDADRPAVVADLEVSLAGDEDSDNMRIG